MLVDRHKEFKKVEQQNLYPGLSLIAAFISVVHIQAFSAIGIILQEIYNCQFSDNLSAMKIDSGNYLYLLAW